MNGRRGGGVPLAEERLAACGDEIVWSPDGITDESGHPAGWYHQHAVETGVARVAGILDLHRADPEGIVPLCVECGKVHPCPTRGIATGELT